MGVIATDEEVPNLRAKIAKLAGQDLSQLQHTKISRYTQGQTFSLHTDSILPTGGFGKESKADWFADEKMALEGNWNSM